MKKMLRTSRREGAEKKAVEVVATTHRVAVAAVQDLQATVECVTEAKEADEPSARRPNIAASSITLQLNVPAGEAFAILVRGMEGELTVDQHQARQRIQRSYDLSSPVNIQRLFEERLQDLDVLLFGGALGGKVPVVWKAFPPHLWGETTGGRPGEAGQKSAICIELAECLLLFAATRPDWVLGTLIHELLHVYALVMSPKHEMCRCGHRVAHGPGFAAAAKAAVKVLEVKGLALESVGNWEMGYCHSDHDEVVLQAIERMREESGECTLSEELRGTVLSWWAGIEQIVVDGVDARKME